MRHARPNVLQRETRANHQFGMHKQTHADTHIEDTYSQAVAVAVACGSMWRNTFSARLLAGIAVNIIRVTCAKCANSQHAGHYLRSSPQVSYGKAVKVDMSAGALGANGVDDGGDGGGDGGGGDDDTHVTIAPAIVYKFVGVVVVVVVVENWVIWSVVVWSMSMSMMHSPRCCSRAFCCCD